MTGETDMRFAIAFLGLAVLAGTATADTLVDQTWIVDTYAYDQMAAASTIGGWSVMGDDYDGQVVDDFTVPAPGYTITDVWFDYIAYWGGGAPPTSLIEIFPDAGGYPGEVAVAHDFVGATSAPWAPIIPGASGERHHASGLAIDLAPGHYWIGMQPITLQSWGGNGDVYLPVQDIDISPSGDTYLREPGIDPDINHEGSLGFGPLLSALGVPDFVTPVAGGMDAGDSSFRVDGFPIPEPATLGLLTLGALAVLNRRRL